MHFSTASFCVHQLSGPPLRLHPLRFIPSPHPLQDESAVGVFVYNSKIVVKRQDMNLFRNWFSILSICKLHRTQIFHPSYYNFCRLTFIANRLYKLLVFHHPNLSNLYKSTHIFHFSNCYHKSRRFFWVWGPGVSRNSGWVSQGNGGTKAKVLTLCFA